MTGLSLSSLLSVQFLNPWALAALGLLPLVWLVFRAMPTGAVPVAAAMALWLRAITSASAVSAMPAWVSQR